MSKRFDKHQIEALELAFKESKHLTKEKKIELEKDTGLDVEQIASWFNRKRAQERANEFKTGLQEALQESIERETKLKNELHESKKREEVLYAENQRLRQQLGMIADDSMFDPALSLLNGTVLEFDNGIFTDGEAGSDDQFLY